MTMRYEPSASELAVRYGDEQTYKSSSGKPNGGFLGQRNEPRRRQASGQHFRGRKESATPPREFGTLISELANQRRSISRRRKKVLLEPTNGGPWV